MSTQVEICNIALSRIGAGTITSITELTEPAIACNHIYDQVAENIMSGGAWTNVIYRQSLAQTTNTPLTVRPKDFTFEYQLPTSPKFLKLIGISECRVGDLNYVIEQDKLLTDNDTVKILYLGFNEIPASYGPFLTQAIISRLSAELSYKFSGNAKLSQALSDQAEEDFVNGLAMDSQQNSKDKYRTTTLTDPRIFW